MKKDPYTRRFRWEILHVGNAPNLFKSRRFQFHLGTAVILSFVGPGLVWVNTLPNFDYETGEGAFRKVRVQQGWPFPIFSGNGILFPFHSSTNAENKSRLLTEVHAKYHDNSCYDTDLGVIVIFSDHHETISWSNLGIDIAVATAIIIAFALAAERVMYRKPRHA